MAFYNTRNKCYFDIECELWLKSTSLAGWTAGSSVGLSAGRVLEELELKPTQPPTVVGLGLGFGLSLAISKLESMSDGSETYFILSLDPIKSLWEPTTVSEPINPDTI